MSPPDLAVMNARPAGPGVARLATLAEMAPPLAGSAPLWRLNSGAEMVTCIDGLNQNAPIILVVELASVTFSAPEIEMMREHWIGPIGRWTQLAVDMNGPKGPGIYGSPIFYTSETDAERDMYLLREADEVAALLRRKHPWQASVEIGGPVEQYQLVPPGESVTVDGVAHLAPVGPNVMPLYVLHAGICSEASVCLRGADTETGPTLLAARAAAAAKLAATKPTPKDITMDLKALLAKYPDEKCHGKIARLHAAGQTAEQIATALLADEKTSVDAEIATLKANLETANKAAADAKLAADTKIAELQGKIDALKPPADGAAPAASVTAGAEGGAADAKLAAPKSVSEGIARLQAAGVKGDGFALRKATLAKWPALRVGIDKLHAK